VHERYGFESLEDYVDHFDWGKLVPPGEKEVQTEIETWVAKTWRVVKAIPITDPATGALICNYYSSNGNQEALRETNGFLFTTIPAASP
jgi:hypothetical protein